MKCPLKCRRAAGLLAGLAAALGGAVAPSGAAAADEPPLVEGTFVTARLAKGEAAWTRSIDVPGDVATLRVIVESRYDVDLYLRRGRPVEDDFPAEADAKSNGDAGDERAEVSPAAGTAGTSATVHTWFVTVAHPGAERGGASFHVVALFESCGRPPLVLGDVGEGGSLPVAATPPGEPFRFRTWFPVGAESLIVSGCSGLRVVAAGGAGLRKVAEAPGGGPVVLRRADGWPAGLCLVEARAPVGTMVAAKVSYPAPERPENAPLLSQGIEEEFRLAGGVPSRTTFRIVATADGPGFVVVTAADAGNDVDLFVRRGSPFPAPGDDDQHETADYLAIATGATERLVMGGEEGLPAGTYYLDVVATGDDRVAGTVALETRPRAGLRECPWGRGGPPMLQPGRWQADRIETCNSAFRWYGVDVPEGAKTLHVQVVGATGPTDLVLARRDTGAVVARSLTERVDERLTASFGKGLLPAGRYAVGVVERTFLEDEVDFRVAFALDAAPALPDSLRLPPFHPPGTLNPTEAVAAAVVEISAGDGAGSGVCLTPGGLILTCHHVLEDDTNAGKTKFQDKGILVAFPDDFRRPPRQTHVAEVIEADADLDLALLRITEDAYGRPVRVGPGFPWVPLGDSETLHLGDPLTALGYPGSATEHARTEIIVGRGMVLGFESSSKAPIWIKTDAWIAHGNSGGAVVDSRHRLVGIAAALLGDSPTLGLVRPVSRLPQSWKLLIDKGLSK